MTDELKNESGDAQQDPADVEAGHMEWLRQNHPYAWQLAERDRRVRAGVPDMGDQKKASVTVRRTMKALNPEVVKDEMIEIVPFVTSTAIVSRQYEAAVKDDNGYQIGKCSVFVSVPCYVEEVPEMINYVKGLALSELKEAMDVARGKKKENTGTLPATSSGKR